MAPPFPSLTKTFHSKAQPGGSPSRPELSAQGKNVLISGGGTGIGAETARYFAEAGASRIALLGRREQPLLDTKASINEKFPKVDVFIASTDVADKAAVDAAFAKFLGNDKLHVLVSNAAIAGPKENLNDVDAAMYTASILQNVNMAINMGQALLRHGAKDAVAIDVNSAAAHINFGTGVFAAYSVSKMAVYKIWDTLAYTNPEMSVYHVQPGIVDTEMNREAGGVEAIGYEDHVSLPASFHLWLASPEAKFLKGGKFLYTNWDIDELKAMAKELESTPKLRLDLVGWPFSAADWKLGFTEGSDW